jgi:two-component sensor histidine kinase
MQIAIMKRNFSPLNLFKKEKCIILFLSLFSIITLKAQDNLEIYRYKKIVDSLTKEHNIFFESDFKKSEKIANEILDVGKKSNDYKLIVHGYRAIRRCQLKLRNYKKILHTDTLIFNIAAKNNNEELLFLAHTNFATNYIDNETIYLAFPHLQQALDIAEKSKRKDRIALVSNRLGWYKLKLYEYKEAITYFEKSIENNTDISTLRLKAETQWGLCEALLGVNDFNRILSILPPTIEYFRITNSEASLGSALGLLSKCYFELGNYDKGLQTLIEVRELYKKSNNKVSEASALIDIGGTYLSQGKNVEARKYLIEAQTILNNTTVDFTKVSLLTQWGVYYSSIDKNDSANIFFTKADSLAKKIDNASLIFENAKYWNLLKNKSINLQQITPYKKDGNNQKIYNKALLEVEASYRVLQQRDSLKLQKQALELSNAQMLIKNNKLKLYSLENEAAKSLLKVRADSIQIQNFQKQYDNATINKQKSDLLLSSQKLKIEQQQKMISQRNTVIFMVFSLIALAASLIFFYLKSKADKATKLAKELSITNINLKTSSGHIMTNVLSAMNIYIHQFSSKATDHEIASSLSSKFDATLKLWQHIKVSEQFNSIQLETYITKVVEEFNSIYSFNKKVALNLNAPVILTTKGEAEDLVFLNFNSILIELLQNSFKHAFKNIKHPTIDIIISENNHAIKFYYKDNGIGYIDEPIKNNGLKVIHGSVKSLKGDYTFNGVEGFCFECTFPHT